MFSDACNHRAGRAWSQVCSDHLLTASCVNALEQERNRAWEGMGAYSLVRRRVLQEEAEREGAHDSRQKHPTFSLTLPATGHVMEFLSALASASVHKG